MTGRVSGLPDDLLTAPPDREAAQLRVSDGEPARVDFSTRESRAVLRTSIAALRESEVWGTLKAFYLGERERLVNSLTTLAEPHLMLKVSGELKSVENVLKWPEMMLGVIKQLDERQDKLEAQKKELENVGRSARR